MGEGPTLAEPEEKQPLLSPLVAQPAPAPSKPASDPAQKAAASPLNVPVDLAAVRPRGASSTSPIPDAIRLDPEPQTVAPKTLLRHAISILRSQPLPSSGRVVQVGRRRVDLIEAPLTAPAARRIIDPFRAAAEGHADGGRRALSGKERLDALYEGARALDAYLAEQASPPGPDVQAAREIFEASYAAEEQVLVGLIAADSVRSQAASSVDPTARGLAAPTLINAYVVQEIDSLIPALNDVANSVTMLTRLQSKQLTDISTGILKSLGSGGGLPPGFSPSLFGFLSSVVFLRATLNTVKGVINAGDVATSKTKRESEKAILGLQFPGKLLEGLFAGMYFSLAMVHVIRGDSSAAARALAEYSFIGRGIVWSTAIAQMLGGLTNLLTVAIGDQKFKRSFVFDTLYGAAGSLAPLERVASAAAKSSLERANRKVAQTFVEGSIERELELEVIETTGSRIGSKIANLARGRAGAATGYVLAADLAIQTVALGLEHYDKNRVSKGLTSSLRDIENFAGAVSVQALELHSLAETPRAAAPGAPPSRQASESARRLFEVMQQGLFAFGLRHSDKRGPSTLTGSYNALGRRLAEAETALRGVDPNDPASVLLATRHVLLSVRKIFNSASAIYFEELKKLDDERVFFNEVHGATPGPPNKP